MGREPARLGDLRQVVAPRDPARGVEGTQRAELGGVGRRGRGHAAGRDQALRQQVAALGPAHSQRQVGLAAGEIGVADAGVEIDPDPRVAGVEPDQRRRDEDVGDPGRRGQPDHALGLGLDRVERDPELAERPAHVLGRRHQLLAFVLLRRRGCLREAGGGDLHSLRLRHLELSLDGFVAWRQNGTQFVADPIEPAAEPGNFDDHGADIIQEPRPVVTPPAPQPIIYTFDLRHLDPTSEISGLQGRLRHLGYPVGPADGTLDPRGEEALRAFQSEHGLDVTGELDQATQDKLRERADG